MILQGRNWIFAINTKVIYTWQELFINEAKYETRHKVIDIKEESNDLTRFKRTKK